VRPMFFKTPAAFRAWLARNHHTARELLVGLYHRKSGKGGPSYQEVLDEALCFGWIDGVRRNYDATSYTIRFTPRKPTSIWSAVNIKRVGELTARGRMRPSGLTAFRKRDRKKARLYSFENRPRELNAGAAREFRAHKQAWAWFQAQAPWYRRTASWWVMSAKKEETRSRRLAALIASSAQSRRAPGFIVGRKEA
jgi:uncharacterized protein YdeI (YjbR/CyaY-like superfamily)